MNLHFHEGQWDAACDLVEQFHYSGRVPANVQFVGSLHEPGGLFGDFGPIQAAAFFSIPPTRWSEPVIELSRLVRGHEKAPLTSLISKSCVSLKKLGFDLIVSFADETQGHNGGVYRACSWLYAGYRKPRMDGVLINDVFIPGRSVNSKWGTQSPKKLRKMGIDAIPHYDGGKHLYFKPLRVSGKSKAKRLNLKNQTFNAARRCDERTPVCASQVEPLGAAP